MASNEYWVPVDGGRYRLGLEEAEARRVAELSAALVNAQPLDALHEARDREERALRSGNVDWVARRLLTDAPARDVELAPFSIARRPVTIGEFRTFLRAVGGPEPKRWKHYSSLRDDAPVMGVPWSRVVAYCRWAGARIPFEDEWERAARGPERRMFPWGNELGDRGAWLLQQPVDVAIAFDRADAARLATPEGVEVLVARTWEWCADLWAPPAGTELASWHARWNVEPWWRVVRGGDYDGIVAHQVSRRAGLAESESGRTWTFRLVKADGREIPAAPPMSGWSGAMAAIRTFERETVTPALTRLIEARRFEDHRTVIFDVPDVGHRGPDDHVRLFWQLRDAYQRDFDLPLIEAVSGAYLATDDQPIVGMSFAAVSTETVRRVTPLHGIFLWNVLYRLDGDRVLAQPVVFYRMAYDGRLHRFAHRFIADEVATPIDKVTQEMIARHVVESFRFYEQHADADGAPR